MTAGIGIMIQQAQGCSGELYKLSCRCTLEAIMQWVPTAKHVPQLLPRVVTICYCRHRPDVIFPSRSNALVKQTLPWPALKAVYLTIEVERNPYLYYPVLDAFDQTVRLI